MSSRNDDCARRARSVLAVSSGRARTSSGTTAVAASATPRGSSGLRRTLDVGNAAPARLLASGEIGPHSTHARDTVSPLALPDAPRGSVFISSPLCATSSVGYRCARKRSAEIARGIKCSGFCIQKIRKCPSEESAVAVRKSCAGGLRPPAALSYHSHLYHSSCRHLRTQN